MSCQATIENTETGEVFNLPCEFNVNKVYVKKKRKSVKRTSKAIFVQTAVPLFIHGDEGFEWVIEVTIRSVAQFFYNVYEQDVVWRYTGCMGEVFLIEMREPLEIGKAICGRHPLSSTWTVLCIVEDYDWGCGVGITAN